MRWFFTLLLILALAAGLSLSVALRSYRIFGQEELVAVVECAPPAPGPGQRFLLKVRLVSRGAPGREETYLMQGEQWTVSGDILKWEPWLSFMGVKPVHKLTRLSSRYLAAGRESAGPHSVYDLNGGSPPLWRWLHRFGPALPLVDAVYGSAAYTDARPGARWGVHVTHSGYLIRPLR